MPASRQYGEPIPRRLRAGGPVRGARDDGGAVGAQQRRRLNQDQRDAPQLSDRLGEGGEDGQADQGLGAGAGRQGLLGYLQRDRPQQPAHCADRGERVGATLLHELAPGLACHDLLHVAAEGVEGQAVLLDEAGEVRGRRERGGEASVAQPLPKADTGLNVATRAGREYRQLHKTAPPRRHVSTSPGASWPLGRSTGGSACRSGLDGAARRAYLGGIAAACSVPYRLRPKRK
ncbi:MAG: hypothetical protein RLZZ387_4108 [Chloroflexota bacterium]|jgi:hypothetical protein